jgi:hypothetical protein
MGFHTPVGTPEKVMPHYVAREQREVVAEVVAPFLQENEYYVIHGIYNTKDHLISVTGHQSLGRIIVTNTRLIFWPDNYIYPHLAIDFESIGNWELQWMLNSRGLFFFVDNQRHMFGTHKSAAKVIVDSLGPEKQRK